MIIYKSGEPCTHKTCRNHIITPCDVCGRIGMNGDAEIAEMERLDKGYAIIYIDRTGESFEKKNYESIKDFNQNWLANDYYSNSGHIQWNYYLIIAKEVLPEGIKASTIEKDDKYARKYVVPLAKIDKFVNANFPDYDKKAHGTIKLIKGSNWEHAIKLADKYSRKADVYKMIGSISRKYDDLDTLKKLDVIRTMLITSPNERFAFYTHLTDEFSYAQKKFKNLFLK